MNANELRLGNYVYFPFTKEVVKILGINAHEKNGKIENSISFMNGKNLYCEKIDKLQAIDLTDDWLEKLGFNLTKTCHELKGMSMLFYDGWNLNYDKGHDDYSAIGFWDVHEFQNLYFALTKEELVVSTAVR